MRPTPSPPSPTNPALPALDRYDGRTIALHWATAALVAALWTLGETIDWFPKGSLRVGARGVHIVLGATLAAVLLARVQWRLTGGLRLPPASHGLPQRLASAVHVLLYVLLAAVVLLGLANAWVRGDTLFGWFTIPAFDPGNKPLRETVEELHGLAANTLLVVAGGHALAALVHHVGLKDGVLARMRWSRAGR